MDMLQKIFVEPFVDMVAAPDFLMQVIWEGLVSGVLYALIALGFVLIFRSSRIFNFAQGIMVVFAALTLVGLHAMGIPAWLSVALPLVVMFAALFGAGWAAIPAYLQAKRGSHIVITTIMFNFIAASFIAYLLVEVFKPDSSMIPESEVISLSSQLPKMHDWFELDPSPWNVSFILALIACFGVWLFIYKTPIGYEIRAFGFNPSAAHYAGIRPLKATMIAMMLSGGLAGLFAINVINGELHQLKLNFVEGFGFTGIAVALMGRSHPFGVLLAAVLFGFLYQGGAELAFWYENVDRNIVVVLQGLIILFCGALEHIFRPSLLRLYIKLTRKDPLVGVQSHG